MSKWRKTYWVKSDVRLWRRDVGQIEISVHRSSVDKSDEWYLTTLPRLFCVEKLKSKDAEEAKAEAIGLVELWLIDNLSVLWNSKVEP